MKRRKKKKDKDKDSLPTEEQILKPLKKAVSSEYSELLQLLRRPRRFLWSNFLLGLVRGIGIAIGVTILGGVIVSLFFFLLNKMTSVPKIGDWIGTIIKNIREIYTNRIY